METSLGINWSKHNPIDTKNNLPLYAECIFRLNEDVETNLILVLEFAFSFTRQK